MVAWHSQLRAERVERVAPLLSKGLLDPLAGYQNSWLSGYRIVVQFVSTSYMFSAEAGS